MVSCFTTLAVVTFAAAAASLCSVSHAHSTMSYPKPQFPEGFYFGNSPYARLDSKQFAAGADIPGYKGVEKITANMGTSTLRDFVYKYANISESGATIECGKTLMTIPPVAVPDEIDWRWGHPGPCEAWCDDTKIFSNGDCQGNKMGKIKVDKDKCANAKRLQVFYAGVHVDNYEIYANCVPLTGSGQSATSTGNEATTTMPPKPATDAPVAAATKAPPAETYKPAPTPTATSKATKAPTPETTKKNCTRRLRY